MRLVGIGMVRNEADVVEPFVRHSLGVLDALLVVDHRSIDGTTELLDALAREGLPLDVRREERVAQDQAEVLTGLMLEAAAEGADWIVPLDADELLVGPVRERLGQLDGALPAAVRWRSYIPAAGDDPREANPFRRLRHRRRTEISYLSKVLVPGAAARGGDVELHQGSHHLLRDREPVDVVPLGDVALAHFPVRSAAQLARKVVAGWPANLARADPADQGWQWKREFDRVCRGDTAVDLTEAALDYGRLDGQDDPDRELVEDPVPHAPDLRLRVPPAPSVPAVLGEIAEALAREIGSRAPARA